MMPYKIRENDGHYEVINEDTGEVKARHTTKEDAERQVRLLEAIEHDADWEPRNNG